MFEAYTKRIPFIFLRSTYCENIKLYYAHNYRRDIYHHSLSIEITLSCLVELVPDICCFGYLIYNGI